MRIPYVLSRRGLNATVAGHADSPADRWVDHRYDRGFGNIFRQWEFERRK